MRERIATLLFVAPDAPQRIEDLGNSLGSFQVTPCTSLAAARAHLSGTAFDAVLTVETLPDGTGFDLVDLCERLDLAMPVVAHVDTEASAKTARKRGLPFVFSATGETKRMASMLNEVLARSAPETSDTRRSEREECADGNGTTQETTAGEGGRRLHSRKTESAQEVLTSLEKELGRMAHALNNPLAVVSGNAQYALELSRALEVESEVTDALKDIDEAGERLRGLLQQLDAIREDVASLAREA